MTCIVLTKHRRDGTIAAVSHTNEECVQFNSVEDARAYVDQLPAWDCYIVDLDNLEVTEI